MVSASLPSSKTSNKGLIVLLVITLVLTVWTAWRGEAVEDSDAIALAMPKREAKGDQTQVARMTQPSMQQKEESSERLIPWQRLQREQSTTKAEDVFKVHSWQPAVVIKKTKLEPPPAPVAPPVPFVYMGKLEGLPNQVSTVFLIGNNKVYSVPLGSNVTPQWRLDAEEANALQLTYLPLNLTQTLSKLAKSPTTNTSATTAELAVPMNENKDDVQHVKN